MINEIDLANWKQNDIITDDLWLFDSRDRSGKHKNIYHGNFIPQIPYQLISRYTRPGDVVLDPFCGSGTTLFECEKLGRKSICLDINSEILNCIKAQMNNSSYNDFALNYCDNTSIIAQKYILNSLNFLGADYLDFVIYHPPYFDIIKFTQNPSDLSNSTDLSDFLDKFNKCLENTLKFLRRSKYFAIVIGNIYKNSEIVPLGFLVMNSVKANFKTKLKGIIVKNIEGNRGKLGVQGIWRYRALRSDYYIFKHEYIFVFKKEF